MHDLVPLEYGQYYHIYNRGNSGENIFIEERNYPYFLGLYVKFIEPIADTFAYTLLRDHSQAMVLIKFRSRSPSRVGTVGFSQSLGRARPQWIRTSKSCAECCHSRDDGSCTCIAGTS